MRLPARLLVAFLEGLARETGARAREELERWHDERRSREADRACLRCGRPLCCPQCGEANPQKRQPRGPLGRLLRLGNPDDPKPPEGLARHF